MSRRAALIGALVAGSSMLGGCSGGTPSADDPSPVASTAIPASPTCPSAARAEPDPDRPRMALSFDLSADHAKIEGRERIAFEPDRPIDELVFRLSANSLTSVEDGNRITVTSATADHGAGAPTYSSINADPATQGGLLRLPFAKRVPAGTTVTADLTFTLTLGQAYFDRFGRAGKFAWFGSAEPLLAWQDGVGWHTEAMSALSAETTTSEAMDVDLRVRAPGRDTVLMSGDPADPPASSHTRTWRSHLDAARDVSVAAGPFVVGDAKVGDVRLRVGSSSARDAAALSKQATTAVLELSRRFGSYPFSSLSIARVPARGGGIEYPSSLLLFGDEGQSLVSHEVAHQWFYAMVGNSQARHPWLDEAFATYAQQLVDDQPEVPGDLNRPGRVDSSIESYGDHVYRYFYTTYSKGSAALRAARDAAGGDAFDTALRCYVAQNAWRIAEPKDLAAALSDLPRSRAVLRQAGALP